MKIHYRTQENEYLCGPACLQMVLLGFGVRQSQRTLGRFMATNAHIGTTRRAMTRAARSYEFRVTASKEQSLRRVQQALTYGTSVIVNYLEPENDDGHYAVVRELTPKSVVLFDPWHGPRYTISRRNFLRRWRSGGTKGVRRWMMTLAHRGHGH